MEKPWRLSKLIFFPGRDKNLTKPRRALLRESERRKRWRRTKDRDGGGSGIGTRVYSGVRKEAQRGVVAEGIDIGVPGGVAQGGPRGWPRHKYAEN